MRIVDSADRAGDGPDLLLRIGIAVFFGIFGAEKFSSDPGWLKLFHLIGWGDWFRYFTGLVEISGAVLVLIPATVTIGVALLVCTMASAALIHAGRIHDGGAAFVPALIAAVLAGFAAIRRNA